MTSHHRTDRKIGIHPSRTPAGAGTARLTRRARIDSDTFTPAYLGGPSRLSEVEDSCQQRTERSNDAATDSQCAEHRSTKRVGKSRSRVLVLKRLRAEIIAIERTFPGVGLTSASPAIGEIRGERAREDSADVGSRPQWA